MQAGCFTWEVAFQQHHVALELVKVGNSKRRLHSCNHKREILEYLSITHVNLRDLRLMQYTCSLARQWIQQFWACNPSQSASKVSQGTRCKVQEICTTCTDKQLSSLCESPPAFRSKLLSPISTCLSGEDHPQDILHPSSPQLFYILWQRLHDGIVS